MHADAGAQVWVHRRLGPAGDIRGLVHAIEEAVHCGVELFEEGREVGALGVGKRGEIGYFLVGQDHSFERPFGGGGNEDREVLGLGDDAGAGGALAIEEILEEIAVIGAGGIHNGAQARREERIGVDLAVRVLEGHADFLAAVFKGEYLLHAVNLR